MRIEERAEEIMQQIPGTSSENATMMAEQEAEEEKMVDEEIKKDFEEEQDWLAIEQEQEKADEQHRLDILKEEQERNHPVTGNLTPDDVDLTKDLRTK